MRKSLVLVHRWLGLATAGFLFITGLTGAIIAWEHELDAWLNPHLYHASSGPSAEPPPLSPLILANRLEREHPNARVGYLPLGIEPGHTASLYVAGRIDPKTGQPIELPWSQLAYDPYTGQLQGARLWGELSLSRVNLLPFIYKLHYSLHLPIASGVDLGIWLLGFIAIAWTIDSLVALWIAFPSRRGWRRSFAFRFRGSGHRLTFDLHRSGGVWVWGLLVILAVTAVSMNLEEQVVRPVVSIFSDLTPDPFHDRSGKVDPNDARPTLTREHVLEIALAEAARRGLSEPAGAIYHAPASGLYGVGFFSPGQDHADGKLGNPWLYFDMFSGELVGDHLPGEGTAGDLFMQLQFPLHSGRLFGVAGRAAISVLGVVIAMLSVTGVMLWARRRRSRARRQAPAEVPPHVVPAAPPSSVVTAK